MAARSINLLSVLALDSVLAMLALASVLASALVSAFLSAFAFSCFALRSFASVFLSNSVSPLVLLFQLTVVSTVGWLLWLSLQPLTLTPIPKAIIANAPTASLYAQRFGFSGSLVAASPSSPLLPLPLLVSNSVGLSSSLSASAAFFFQLKRSRMLFHALRQKFKNLCSRGFSSSSYSSALMALSASSDILSISSSRLS